jgi:3-hydroxyisobutyrate dehydrogenase-like beta-hydroxyacid dehydrogenase
MDKVKEVLAAKVVEATTYIKGMSIHESEITFLGLDKRSQVLAQHLLNAGVRIRLWEPKVTSPAERQLGGENVALFTTIAEAIKPAHVVFINLTKSEFDTISQDEVMARKFHHKTMIVCTPMSTIESAELSNYFTKIGAFYVEVAFCGSTSVAEKAQLKLLVSGPEDHYEKVKPVLSVFGTLFYAGAVPKATAIKQSVDLVLAAENAALALACTHLHKQGFDSSTVFLNVLQAVRGSDLAAKLDSFEQRKYNHCSSFTNDEILMGLSNMAIETSKTGMDANMLVSLIKYTDIAKRMSGGHADIASVYDILNPPATSVLSAK